MSVDVLAVLDRFIAEYFDDDNVAQDERDFKAARAAVAELIEATKNYYTGYCQDEADEDDDDMRCCSREQHEAAARLRAALANIGETK